MRAYSKLQGYKGYIQAISGMMKQKKIRRGFIPEDVLYKVHASEDFMEINFRTDIRTIRENLKAGKGRKKGKK